MSFETHIFHLFFTHIKKFQKRLFSNNNEFYNSLYNIIS